MQRPLRLLALTAVAVAVVLAPATPLAAQEGDELVVEGVDASGFPLVRAVVEGPPVDGELDDAFVLTEDGEEIATDVVRLRSDEMNKPAALSDEEFESFRSHPGYGERLLENIPAFRAVLPAVGSHHEKWDGSGYPLGLKGDEIPLMARIMSVADTYDAMTSHRAYRSALKHSVASAELSRCAGTQFDPGVVTAFLVAIEGWRADRKAAGREYPR